METTMFKRKTPSMRAGFLVIAISLAITTTILGMSAYLTDTDEYTSTFRTATGNELGFKITGTNYKNEAIIPGDTVYLNSAAVIEKENDLYIFVEIDIPSDFTVHGFDQAIWRPISDASNIYYYGTNTKLVPLGTTNGSSVNIIESITLSTEVENGREYTVSITGYAIQADYIPDTTSPATVFGMI